MPEAIPRSTQLTEEEQAAEEQFASAIETDVDGYLAKYEELFGNIINTDSAKLLFAPYADNTAMRVKYSRATYGPAKWLMNEMFDRRVRSDETQFIIFMAGGTASGKSSCAEVIGEDLERADLIVDGTLSNAELAKTQIGLALQQGCTTHVMHVYCGVEEALTRAVKRSLKINRTLSLNVFAGSHYHCRRTVENLLSVFGRHSGFRLKIVDNRNEPLLISGDDVAPFLNQRERPSLDMLEKSVYGWFDEVCKNYEQEIGISIPANIREAFLIRGREVSKT